MRMKGKMAECANKTSLDSDYMSSFVAVLT